MKVSLDLIVDKANELYASLPGAGSSKEFPFVEINIKHLNLQDGTGENVLPKDITNYKTHFQLDVKEEIEIKGIKISGRAGSKLPRHIELRVLANLDLANEKNNQTKLYLDLSQTIEEAVQEKVSTTQDEDFNTTIEYKTEFDEVKESILNFTFADGRLTHTFNPSAYLVPGWYSWQQILHGPIGNLIYNALDGVNHEQAETFKTRYDHQYDVSSMVKEYDFKGMVIDNLDIGAIIKGLLTKATGAAAAEDTQPTDDVKEKNYYNGIVKALMMFKSQGNGKFGIGLHGLLDDGVELLHYFGLNSLTIANKEDPENPTVLPLTKAGLIPFLKDAVEGFMNMLTSDGLLTLDGCDENKDYPGGTFIQKLEFLFGGKESNEGNITFDFDFTNGINWELYWLAQDNEEKAPVFKDVVTVTEGKPTTTEKNKVTDKGVEDVSIRYKSTIKFNETLETIATDPFTDMFAAKKTYEDGIGAVQPALDAAKAETKKATDAYNEKVSDYNKTQAAQDYSKAQEDYDAAFKSLTELLNESKKLYSNWDNSIGMQLSMYVTWFNENSNLKLHISQNKSKPLYKWVAADAKDSGSEWEAVKAKWDALMEYILTKVTDAATQTKLGNLFDKNFDEHKATKSWTYDGDLYNEYVAFGKALYKVASAQTTAESLQEYKDMTAAEKTMKEKQKAEKTAQEPVSALEDPYFVYFYMDMNDYKQPAEPQPAPTEPTDED